MSESRKSRRRFLADMLFLGGGLTAAGLLARSQLLDKEAPTTDPTPAFTSEPQETSCPVSTPSPDSTPCPVETCPPPMTGVAKPPPSLPPQEPVIKGKVAAPRIPVQSPKITPAQNPPQIEGRRHIPSAGE